MQAYIPFHGTPTVLLFGQNRRSPAGTVRAVMGKRREPGTPDDPAKGLVWSSIAEGWNTIGFENEYVSVADLPRETLAKHPWSLSGGGAAELRQSLEKSCKTRLSDVVERLGFMTILKQDDVYLGGPRAVLAEGLVDPIDLVEGNRVRDYSIHTEPTCLFPYERSKPETPLVLPPHSAAYAHFWKYRKLLQARTSTGFRTVAERGLLFYEYAFYFPETYASTSIAFAFVATHNHFVLDRGGKVFNRSAPVIRLPAGATEDDHLVLIGLLNSSAACLWMKQVFHPKTHASQRHHPDPARAVYEFTTTGLQSFPIPELDELRPALIRLARMIDEGARRRSAMLDTAFVGSVIDAAPTAPELAGQLSQRWHEVDVLREQMVALQEEVDWVCYVAFGLADHACLIEPARYDALTCPRGARPFERLRGRASTVRAKGHALSVEEGEVPPVGTLPEWAEERWRQREIAIKASSILQLCETPVFKRAWRDTEHNIAEAEFRRRKNETDLQSWLTGRMEAWAKRRTTAFTLGQMVAAVQDDRAVLVAAEVLSERRDFSIEKVLQDLLVGEAVPQHRFHVYTESGVAKRAAWEEVWALQRREDAGESIGPIPDLPEYSQGSRGKSTDFLRNEYWQLRGKLDVPRERFIAFTEVPGRSGVETLYGWAGWTAQQRVKAILAIDEELEDASVPLADRVGLLDSAWRLLTDVAREDPAAATRLKAELQALVGPEGPSRQLIEDWKKRFPPPTARAARTRRLATSKAATDAFDSFDDWPTVIPNLSAKEDAVYFIWAFLHASGGTATRIDLARAFALRAHPNRLKRLAPASLKGQVAHWLSTVGSRSVKAGLLASTLEELVDRNGVLLGTNGESRATVRASPHTLSEEKIDPWFRFEAGLALQVLRAQPAEDFSAIDKLLSGADRKLLESAA